MEMTSPVTVTVLLSGWLAGYFNEPRTQVTTAGPLDVALIDIQEQVMARATRPVPQGGMHVLINGVEAHRLVRDGYVLRDGDEIAFVPVVAGG